MKLFFVFALALLIFALALLVTVASADSPQPYQYALVKCSGLDVAQVQAAEQKFDTAYGFRHKLTSTAQWVGTYDARVNEFASSVGCPKVLDDGQLTFWYRIYVPTYGWYLGDFPAPD